jgi:large subunit ribosomal protein L23
MNGLTMALKPRLSEQAYAHSQALNVFVFQVPANSSKHSIATSVETQFGVTVIKVNVANTKGKAKRTFFGKNGRPRAGSRADVKKAYVTLKQGDSIPIYAAEEEAEAKAEKAAEKAEKKAKKEKK